MEFSAEITEIKQRKTQSLDNEYSIKLVTSDPQLLELGKLPPDTTVKVKIEKEN